MTLYVGTTGINIILLLYENVNGSYILRGIGPTCNFTTVGLNYVNWINNSGSNYIANSNYYIGWADNNIVGGVLTYTTTNNGATINVLSTNSGNNTPPTVGNTTVFQNTSILTYSIQITAISVVPLPTPCNIGGTLLNLGNADSAQFITLYPISLANIVGQYITQVTLYVGNIGRSFTLLLYENIGNGVYILRGIGPTNSFTTSGLIIVNWISVSGSNYIANNNYFIAWFDDNNTGGTITYNNTGSITIIQSSSTISTLPTIGGTTSFISIGTRTYSIQITLTSIYPNSLYINVIPQNSITSITTLANTPNLSLVNPAFTTLNSVAYFNGSSYIYLSSGITVTNFTFECWLKGKLVDYPLSGTTYSTVFGSTGSGTSITTTAGIVCSGSSYGTALDYILSGTTFPENDYNWHHIAIVYDGTTVYLYKDSVLNNTTIISLGSITFQVIGGSGNGNTTTFINWTGWMSNLRLWNIAKSAVDILNNYLAIIPNAPNLICSFPFMGSLIETTSGLTYTNTGITVPNNIIDMTLPIYISGTSALVSVPNMYIVTLSSESNIIPLNSQISTSNGNIIGIPYLSPSNTLLMFGAIPESTGNEVFTFVENSISGISTSITTNNIVVYSSLLITLLPVIVTTNVSTEMIAIFGESLSNLPTITPPSDNGTITNAVYSGSIVTFSWTPLNIGTFSFQFSNVQGSLMIMTSGNIIVYNTNMIVSITPTSIPNGLITAMTVVFSGTLSSLPTIIPPSGNGTVSNAIYSTGSTYSGNNVTFCWTPSITGDCTFQFSNVSGASGTLTTEIITVFPDPLITTLPASWVYPTNNNVNIANVIATSYNSSLYYPYYAVIPQTLSTGSIDNNGWMSSNLSIINQKFIICFDTSFIASYIILNNAESVGINQNYGIQHFNVYGSNNGICMTNINNYNDETSLVLIGTFMARQSINIDMVDHQVFTLNNTNSYQYYILKIVNNWGNPNYMAFRKIQFLQTLSPVFYTLISYQLYFVFSNQLPSLPSIIPPPGNGNISNESYIGNYLTFTWTPMIPNNNGTSIQFQFIDIHADVFTTDNITIISNTQLISITPLIVTLNVPTIMCATFNVSLTSLPTITPPNGTISGISYSGSIITFTWTPSIIGITLGITNNLTSGSIIVTSANTLISLTPAYVTIGILTTMTAYFSNTITSIPTITIIPNNGTITNAIYNSSTLALGNNVVFSWTPSSTGIVNFQFSNITGTTGTTLIISNIITVKTTTLITQYPTSWILPGIPSTTNVTATSSYSSAYSAYYAVISTNIATGNWINNAWVSAGSINTNQKFIVCFDIPVIASYLILNNGHSSGTLINSGIKNFSVYGSNNSICFNNVNNYADETYLTFIGTFMAEQHANADIIDPQIFVLNNTITGNGYQYYVLKLANNWGNTSFMSIRRIQFFQVLSSITVSVPTSMYFIFSDPLSILPTIIPPSGNGTISASSYTGNYITFTWTPSIPTGNGTSVQLQFSGIPTAVGTITSGNINVSAVSTTSASSGDRTSLMTITGTVTNIENYTLLYNGDLSDNISNNPGTADLLGNYFSFNFPNAVILQGIILYCQSGYNNTSLWTITGVNTDLTTVLIATNLTTTISTNYITWIFTTNNSLFSTYQLSLTSGTVSGNPYINEFDFIFVSSPSTSFISISPITYLINTPQVITVVFSTILLSLPLIIQPNGTISYCSYNNTSITFTWIPSMVGMVVFLFSNVTGATNTLSSNNITVNALTEFVSITPLVCYSGVSQQLIVTFSNILTSIPTITSPVLFGNNTISSASYSGNTLTFNWTPTTTGLAYPFIFGTLTSIFNPLTLYPIVWYKLGDTSGTIALDSSVSGLNNGTYNGSYTLAQISLLNGVSSTCVYLNGGYISSPYTSINNLFSSSISCWIYLNSVSGSFIYSKQHDGVNSMVILGIGSTAPQYPTGISGKLYFKASSNNNSAPLTSNTILTPFKWYHIVIIMNTTQATLYINGVQDAIQSGNFSIPNDTSVPFIKDHI